MPIGDDWDNRPRLLQELCEGHPAYMAEVYALDLPNRVRLWLCKECWTRTWFKHGKPEQAVTRADA
jgi:hypothetical protein